MKIQLQNVSFYPTIGGIENYLYYASKDLLKKGHEPTILCSQYPNNLLKREIFKDIQIIRHPYFRIIPSDIVPPIPLHYARKLQGFMESQFEVYDVIWSRHHYDAYASGKAFHGGTPILYIQPSNAAEERKINMSNSNIIEKLYTKITYEQTYSIEKKAIEMSNKVVVLSNIRKKEVIDFYGAENNKIEVIPAGVDLSAFHPSKKDEKLLKELGICKNAKIILTVCRLAHQKNIGSLIQAFDKIKSEKTFLIIVGDGNENRSLRRLVDDLSLSKKVFFAGNRKDVNRFYSIADVFVLPSIYEPFGQVFLEAMASGIPCIGLRPDYPKVIVACDKLIQDGRTGYLVDPYSNEDLSSKIERVIFDDELKYQMGKEARRICEENYSWDNCVNSLIQLSLQAIDKI